MGAQDGSRRRAAKSGRVEAGEKFDPGRAEFAGALDDRDIWPDEEAGTDALTGEVLQNGVEPFIVVAKLPSGIRGQDARQIRYERALGGFDRAHQFDEFRARITFYIEFDALELRCQHP